MLFKLLVVSTVSTTPTNRSLIALEGALISFCAAHQLARPNLASELLPRSGLEGEGIQQIALRVLREAIVLFLEVAMSAVDEELAALEERFQAIDPRQLIDPPVRSNLLDMPHHLNATALSANLGENVHERALIHQGFDEDAMGLVAEILINDDMREIERSETFARGILQQELPILAHPHHWHSGARG